ncbi:hypothetical protein Cni_G16722 [Canna indica]|uniref:Uncharacterized protein n=1 Tax=Canna indica TaxID=4628 RepID=A0AAQ3QCT5_9LILI|nr:hypothetical protein Cni_G16722 [Canna indica]
MEDDGGEPALELVVADVELVEELHVVEGRGEAAVELVGVEVEEGEVGQEAELVGEAPLELSVVDVDAGDGHLVGVIEGVCAVHAGVVADVRPTPVLGYALRVGGDGVLPCLEGDVGLLKPRVGRGESTLREEGQGEEEEEEP